MSQRAARRLASGTAGTGGAAGGVSGGGGGAPQSKKPGGSTVPMALRRQTQSAPSRSSSPLYQEKAFSSPPLASA